MGLRSKMHKAVRIYDTITAARKGRLKKHAGRSVAGKISNKVLNRLFK
ncbi:hypothetical protein [Pontibacillus halophilus]|nr:hypothetical protein [Pontibacillus halophilus]